MIYIVTVGWTINTKDREYVSFADGWKEGAPQHAVTFRIVSDEIWSPQEVAEKVFVATNAPGLREGSLEAEILARIVASGWNGDLHDDDLYGHFSLSVGDTVTVNGTRFACASFGWDQL